LDNQSKFLRILEDQRFRRLGGMEEIQVNVRFIAATNMNLQEAIRAGKFREDLYYRLNVFTIILPPLRDRREDIPLLTQAFLDEFSEKHKKTVRLLAPLVEEVLCGYAWPGNIRELRNVIERAVIVCRTDRLSLSDLPTQFNQDPDNPPTIKMSLGIPLVEAERELLLQTLKFNGGNKSQAAKMLGISLKTLYNKLERYGLPSEKTAEVLESS